MRELRHQAAELPHLRDRLDAARPVRGQRGPMRRLRVSDREGHGAGLTGIDRAETDEVAGRGAQQGRGQPPGHAVEPALRGRFPLRACTLVAR